MRDVRYAVRVLRKNPGFTAAAVLTLALGIGLNATIFSIFDAMALRPVQLPGGIPVLSIYQDIRGGSDRSTFGGPDLVSYPEYLDYRDHSRTFSALAAYTPEFRVLVDADVKPLHGQLTTCNFFTALGVSPVLGRGFASQECEATDAGPVVVLSDAFWRSHFAADPHVIGKTLKLNRIAFTVVGVAPAGFTGTDIVAASFWAPLSMQWSLSGRTDPTPFQSREDLGWLALLGRLRPGIGTMQARADLGVVAARRDAAYTGRVTTLSLAEPNFSGRPDRRRVIFAIGTVFLVAVGLVLLIACANVANLFLARATTRQREIAIRLAIGASRAQLVRQLLTESFLVALAGGILGTAASFASATALVDVLLRNPDLDPLAISIAPDFRIFAYALLLVLTAAFGFGLAPALQATRADLNATLRDGGDMGGSRSRLRSSLVGIQVAVSMVLLVTAGLLLRGLAHAASADPGFLVDHAVTMTVDLRAEGYTPERAVAFHRALAERLRTLPGVVASARMTAAPLGGRHYWSGFSVGAAANRQAMEYNVVSPGFFASTGIPVVRGRDFTTADANGNVVIIGEAAGWTLWPGQDPIGKTLRGEHDYTVIGVARDAQVSELGRAHDPYLYISASDSNAIEMGTVIVRSSAPYPVVAGALRSAVLSLDRDLHLKIAPLRDNMRSYVQTSEVLATLSSALAGLALLLASIGIYGTVAFMVARRTREIGIRMALGARAPEVVGMVTRQAMRTIIIGAVAGLGLCVLATRILDRVLFGVSTLDATAFAGVTTLLLGVALLASYVPARRAVRVDPMIALRAE